MKSLKAKFKWNEGPEWGRLDDKLMAAVTCNEPDKVEHLLSKKKLHPYKIGPTGKSAFHTAAALGHKDCLHVILSHQAQVILPDSAGLLALHQAAQNGHADCILLILQEGCPVDVCDSHGRTALHHAAVSGSLHSAEILCDFQVPINTKDKDGSSALSLAAQMCDFEMCHLLLQRGAEVNCRDQQGRTPLMLCCEGDNIQTVHLLLTAGAQVSLVDSMGHNALHYSKAKGKSHVRRILQSVNQPDEQDDLSNCIAYGEGNLNLPDIKDRNSTPRKRKAPPPPNKAKLYMYPEMAQDNKEKKRGKDCSQTKPQRKKKNSPALQEQTIHIPQEQKTPIVHGNCISKTQEPVDPDSQEQINPELEKQVKLDLEENISQKTLVAFIPDLQEEDMSHRMEPFVSNPEEKNTPDSQGQNDSTMYNPCIPSFQEHNVIDISNTEQGHQQLLLLQDVMQQPADNAEMEYDLDILDPPADSSGAEHKFDVMLPASDYSGTEHELFIQSTNHITGVTEKELEELQKEVQFLKVENKELQEKIKILEDYERDGGDMDSSADFVPVVLFDSLQREYERVQQQLREAHNSLQSLQNSSECLTYPSCKLAPTETGEQLDEVQTNYTPTLLETNYTQKLQQNESQKNEDKEMSENIISLQESTKQWEEAEKELRRLRENEEKYKVIEEEWKEMQVIKQQNTEMEEELKRLKENKKYMEMIEALEKYKGSEKLGICIEELGNMQGKEEIDTEKQDKASVLQKNDGQSTVKLKGEIKTIQEQMHIVTFSMQNAGQNMSDGWVQVREKDIEQLKTVTDKYQVLIKEIMDQLQLIQKESDEAQKQLREAHASLLSKDKHIKELQDNQKEAEAAINSEAILKSQLETDYKRAEAELVKLRDYQNEVQDLHKLIDNLRKEAQDLKDQLECAQLSDKCLTSQQYDQRCLNQVEEQLAQTQERLTKALQELQLMQQNTVTIQEHHQMQESLSCEVQDLKIKVRQLDQKLKSREKEIESLQRELDAVQIKDQTNEALKNEVNSLTKKLSELSKQHERTSTEVFQVQREALFMKSEKQAAEEQLEKVQCEKERIQGQLLQLQKEKCHNVEQSVETDKKISELSQEIISLKEALQRNTLKATEKIIDDNQKEEGQQQQKLLKEMECLQLKIKIMKQNQIEEERHHGSVIAIYRDYLLRAVQGQINEDAMRIINQILQMHLRR